METDTDHFRLAKMLFSKLYQKVKCYFQEKIEKNASGFKELWKALKSLGMKSGKVSRSKIALKNNRDIQFEPKKMQIL